MLEQLTLHYHDEAKRLSMAKAGREELEARFERDRTALREELEAAKGWQREPGET
jgi:hypothetical protein